MNIKLILIVAVGLAICSCNPRRDSLTSEEITGTYAREYSFKVVHPETGNEVGMRTIRDTIFVRSIESGYEVSNSKWRFNDYDLEGWNSMEHSEDRPFPAFIGKFESEISSLISESAPEMHFNFAKKQLFKGKGKTGPYLKLE